MTKYVRFEPYPYHTHRKDYGFFHFLFDLFMTIITCGLWFIWILFRALQRNR